MTEELITFATAKLAKEKGFDIKVRDGYEWYIFNEKEYGPTELNYEAFDPVNTYPPLEREQLANADFKEVLQRRPGIMKSISGVMFVNSKLPPWLYARPTQDLLEKWLREKREIHGFVKIERGSKKHNIPQLYYGGYYNGLYDGSEKWEDDKAFQQHRDARENWLYHALTSLP